MKNQTSQPISIQTDMSADQLLCKLNSITTEEFHDAVKSPAYIYYGKISAREFDIRNKKFSPYSTGPGIKGEIVTTNDRTVVIIKVGIEEQMEIVKKMMFPYFIFFGLLIALFGLTMEETRYIALSVGAFVAASPFLYTAIIRRLLQSMQREEMHQFTSLIID